MQVIMFDFIHLDKRNMSLSIHTNVFFKQQMSLLYGDYLISQWMHHKEPTPHIRNMINIRKVVLLELNVLTIVLMKHTGKWTNRTLKNDSLNAVSSRICYHWKCAKAKTPKNDLIKWFLEPSQDQLKIFANDIFPHIGSSWLSISCIIKSNILCSKLVCHFRYKLQRVSKVWRITVSIYYT